MRSRGVLVFACRHRAPPLVVVPLSSPLPVVGPLLFVIVAVPCRRTPTSSLLALVVLPSRLPSFSLSPSFRRRCPPPFVSPPLVVNLPSCRRPPLVSPQSHCPPHPVATARPPHEQGLVAVVGVVGQGALSS